MRDWERNKESVCDRDRQVGRLGERWEGESERDGQDKERLGKRKEYHCEVTYMKVRLCRGVFLQTHWQRVLLLLPLGCPGKVLHYRHCLYYLFMLNLFCHHIIISNNIIWDDIISYDMIWYNVIWYDIMSYDMI